MQFRKDINGLRAIAVIAVVLFHFNERLMPGGFAGVDVFFVISGFLMTKIIFNGIENNNFSIFRFYIARVDRIFPALATLCLFLFFWGWFYLPPIDYAILGNHAGSSLTFLSNIFYWSESGYFDASSYEKWLLHTWSLSAEWQFYIIYPLVLVCMKAFIPINFMKKALLFGTGIGFVFCVISTYKWPDAAYYLLPTRAWEMMIGGVAYLYPFKLKNKQKIFLETIGIIFILGSYLFVTKGTPWPGYLAFLPVIGTFLIIQSQRNNSIITNNIVFQKLGGWSYSIYLWHWPLVVFYVGNGSNIKILPIYILLSIFLGFLSYIFIEKKRKSKKLLFLLIFINTSFFCLVYFSNGADFSIRHGANTKEAKYLSKYQKQNYLPLLKSAYRDECNFLDVKTDLAKSNGISEECTNNGTEGIFIWGDSHGQALSYGIRNAFPNTNVNQIASSSCRPLVKNDKSIQGEFKISCDRSNAAAKKAILHIKPQIIVLIQRDDHHKNNYNEILTYLKEQNLNSKLILIGAIPQWEPTLPSVIVKRHFHKDKKIIEDTSFVNGLFKTNKQLHSLYDNSEIKYISLIDSLCNSKGCLAKVDENNTPLVWDYGHLTLEGSIYVVNNVIKNELIVYLK